VDEWLTGGALVGVASEAGGLREEVPVEEVLASEAGEEVLDGVSARLSAQSMSEEVPVEEVVVGMASEAEGEEVLVDGVSGLSVHCVQSMFAGVFAGLSTRSTSAGLCVGGLVFWRLSAMRSPGAFKVRD
jgi:hypothetical protein